MTAGERPTDALAQAWYDDAMLGRFSPTTARAYYYTIRRFLQYVERPLDEIDGDHVKAWVKLQINTNATGGKNTRKLSTIYRQFMCIRTFFRWCIEEGMVAADPTEKVKVGKGSDRLVEPLGNADLIRLLTYLGTTGSPFMRARNHALTLFLYDTGVRASEALSVRRAQVVGSDTITIKGKGSKYRTIGLNPAPAEAIQRYLEVRDLLVEDDSDALWVTSVGRPLEYPAVREVYFRAGNELHIPDCTAHNIRRTGHTVMVENGISVFALKELGGWARVATAERYVQAAGRRMALASHRQFSPTSNIRLLE